MMTHSDDWLTIFHASRLYGARYEEPPEQKIDWPRATWFQERLKQLRAEEGKQS